MANAETSSPEGVSVPSSAYFRNPPTLARYAFAFFAIALATLLRFLLIPLLGEGVPFILYFPTIVLCAWFGGLQPGLFATALGGVIAWFAFIPPYYTFKVSDPGAPGQLMIFLFAGTLISMLAESLHRARNKAVESEVRERQQREQFRVTLRSIGDAVITTDEQGRITSLNPIAESLTGWTERDAFGLPLENVLVIINEQSRTPAQNPVQRVIREGVIMGLANHTLLIAKDGREIPIDDSAAPIKTPDGTNIGTVLVFRDITERRRTEQERAIRLNDIHSHILSRAEQLAQMGSWHWEPTTDTLTWSNELYQIYGLQPGTPLSFDNFIECVHPDDRERIRTEVTTALKEPRPFRFRERILRPDGQTRVLDSQGDVEKDEDGTSVSVFGFCRDVTEETLIQEELREREQRFAKMFHASPVASCLTTLEGGRFVDANARFLEITGFSRVELIGNNQPLINIGNSKKEHQRLMDEMLQEQSLREVPITYTTRDGRTSNALASVELLEVGREKCLLTLLWRVS